MQRHPCVENTTACSELNGRSRALSNSAGTVKLSKQGNNSR